MDKPKVVDLSSERSIELPPNHHAFSVEMRDPLSGRTLVGEFVCRRMNVGMVRQMAIVKAELNGGKSDEQLGDISGLNMMMAHLRVALTKVPDWWHPEDFFDAEPINVVYEEVMAYEARFRDAAGGTHAQDPAPGGTRQSGQPTA